MRQIYWVMIYAGKAHGGDTETIKPGVGRRIEETEHGIFIREQDFETFFPWHRVHEVMYK